MTLADLEDLLRIFRAEGANGNTQIWITATDRADEIQAAHYDPKLDIIVLTHVSD